MKTLNKLIKKRFNDAALQAFPELDPSFEVEITQSTHEKFGHYQCNSAMKLTKILGMPPRKIAEALIAKLDKGNIIQSLEIAGPGFINITLSPTFLSDEIQQMVVKPHLNIEKVGSAKKVVIDFSSPNTAKEMHVGHLRSTIIGDSLARLFEFLGYDVLRLNHIGDWGTAFGMLIAHMKQSHPEILQGNKKTDLTQLVQWYRESKAKFDLDPEFKKQSQMEVVALQSGNAESMIAWKIICEISRRAYQEIYDLLDIHLVERGESFYNPALANVVADLDAKHLTQVSDGAKCIFLPGFTNREGEPLPLIIQKSDGGYNYASTDLAAVRHRIDVEKADNIFVVTDAGQQTHFAMVFEAAKMAGYYNPLKVRIEHVPFGLVLGPDGKKFRTREGGTEKLIDLLNAAIEHARKIVDERHPDMIESEKAELAHTIGIGALKYADLSCHRTHDYTFSYERMLRFDGNTAVFLLYCYVRVAGIKRRLSVQIEDILKTDTIKLEHPAETALGLHIAQFTESLEAMDRELLPNRLTDYLYGLAEKFNAFYRDCTVEGSPEQNSRLLLCEATARVMEKGLGLLGVKTVSRM